ncbi:hypothetical protein SDC9_111732 [bioreactor metagenome]|uniref:7 transmembrane helices usually fused to an inactive transglutaminase domain-containing protein n=1 Tax=bioreactor metagenome TaxID=1076179 RepID=A0A645BJX5_9ZZZZ
MGPWLEKFAFFWYNNKMSRILRFFTKGLLVGSLFLLLVTQNVAAQSLTADPTNILDPEASASLEASLSASATESGKLSSASAEVEGKIQKKTDEDITATTGKQKSVLAAYLDEHPIGALNWHNFIQKAIRKAIAAGLPANIIVLLLIFPIIASIVAFSRHIIGLKGYGIYIPAVLSVAFASTGIFTGVVAFIAVLASAIITRSLLKHLRLPVLPRTAMLLLGVSVTILALLLIGSISSLDLVLNISIFPLLIIILLTENFMETQLFNSQKEALSITFETLLIAVLCSFLITSETLQKFVILRPELVLLLVGALNFAIGRYTGLRLLEFLRFKDLIGEERNFKQNSGDNQEEE